MSTEPFDDEAYWRGRERDDEWSAPAYWCRACGRPEFIGSPENRCDGCGEPGPHPSDYYRGRNT